MLFLFMAFAHGTEAWQCLTCKVTVLLVGRTRDSMFARHTCGED